jgi:hypothetical protein
MVTVASQNVFYSEIHQNNIFFHFKKIIFDISAYQNDLKTLKIINLKERKFESF